MEAGPMGLMVTLTVSDSLLGRLDILGQVSLCQHQL